jgi:putative CocE/NonD family hydrolase
MMKHENYDSYWKQMGYNWKEYYQQTSDIPMMLIAGWYDGYCKTTIDNYLGLSKIKKSPVHMIMGPWVHGGTGKSFSGDVEFGAGATIFSDMAALGGEGWKSDWYDHFLKGKNNSVEKMKPVHLFIMGTGDGHKDTSGKMYHGGYWRHENTYPLAGTRFEKYYLHSDMSLSTLMPKDTKSSTTYTFDPNNPVPTIGSSTASSQPMWTGGAFNQREKEFTGNPEKGFYGSKSPYLPLKARKDILVFQTEVLKEDMELVGPVTVTLNVSSSALDTDFTVKLVDVYPPSKDYPAGYEMNITDGILRAKFRESSERQVLMKPGEVYKLAIKPFDTGNKFKKGHRIRLDISSSNFPHYEVNPNTGENPAFSSRSQIAENTIYHNSVKASYIELPVVASVNK